MRKKILFIIFFITYLLFGCNINSTNKFTGSLIKNTTTLDNITPQKKELITIKGKIIFPSLKIKALDPSIIIKNTTVSLIETSTLKVIKTTLSDETGNFTLQVENLTNGFYTIDAFKREQTFFSKAIFLRTIIKYENLTINAITENKTILSPLTTAIAVSAIMDKTATYASTLSTVNEDGITLKDNINISNATNPVSINILKTEIENFINQNKDPIEQKYFCIAKTSKTSMTKGEVLEIWGIGFDDTTKVKLGTQELVVTERNENYIKTEVQDIENGDLVLEKGETTSNVIPVKVASIIKLIQGNYQVAVKENELNRKLQIKITDKNNNPVPNLSLDLNITKGTGKFIKDAQEYDTITITTNESGVGEVGYKIKSIGFNDIKVTGGTLESKFREIGVESLGAQGGSLYYVFPLFDTPLIGESNSPITEPLRFLITDLLGNPVPTKSCWITTEYKAFLGGADICYSTDAGSSLNKNTDINGILETNYMLFPYLTSGEAGFNLGVCVGEDCFSYYKYFPAKTIGRNIVNDIQITGGDAQTQFAAREYGAPLLAKVSDSNNNPIPNVPVNFKITRNQGKLRYNGTAFSDTEVQIETGKAGVAGIYLTAGYDPQTVTEKIINVTASIAGKSAIFLENVNQSPNKILSLISPTIAYTNIGVETVYNSIKAKVVDENGDPVNNYTVNFAITSGHWISIPSTATTDAGGIVQVPVTALTNLENAGQRYNSIKATPQAGDFGEANWIFYIYAWPAHHVTKYSGGSGDNQTGNIGEYLPQQLKVQKFDRFDNPCAWEGTQTHFEVIKGRALLNTSENAVNVQIYPGNTGGINVLPIDTDPVTNNIQIQADLIGVADTPVVFTVNVN